MIQNEKQYYITKNNLERFQISLEQLKVNLAKEPSLKNQIRLDAVQSEIEVLQQELEEYKNLQQNGNVQIPLESIEHLAQNLIRARIAKGLTQAALAAKLGMKSQMIQRYETTEYASASLARVLEIARVIENTPRV